MPSAAYLEKAAESAARRGRETAEIIRLFLEGLSRTQIHHQLGLAYSTVSDRLAAAGFPKAPAGRSWTEEENAVVAEAAEDPHATAKTIAHRLPGRNEKTVAVKLRVARLALGIKATRRIAPPPIQAKPPEPQERDVPDWPLPPGAYRDRHGITLPRVSILMEVHHG